MQMKLRFPAFTVLTGAVFSLTACKNGDQNYQSLKSEILKSKSVFAQPAEKNAFVIQSSTQAPNADQKACAEQMEPLINQSEAGTAALVAALAGAMATLRASTENENQPKNSNDQLVVTPGPVKPLGPKQDMLSAWADRNPSQPRPGFGADQLVSGTEDARASRSREVDRRREANDQRDRGQDQLQAGAEDRRSGSGIAPGNDRLQLQPASAGGDRMATSDELNKKMIALESGRAEDFAGTIAATSLSAGRESFGGNDAVTGARRRPASAGGPAGLAGIAAQNGPNLFRIVTQTYGQLCEREKLIRCPLGVRNL